MAAVIVGADGANSEMSQTHATSHEGTPPRAVKAVEVRAFGGLAAIHHTDAPVPSPGDGQVLVRVLAAGVGPWDALVREGRSDLRQPLPLVLGSDLSGVVDSVGPGVNGGMEPGEEVYGVTNRALHRRLCRVRGRRSGHDRP